ncbi:hypothetical protein JCM11641_000896 [Rhodosporidiobolus odoratus]
MVALLAYDQLQPWQRDNSLIRTGYRPLAFSYLRSLFTVVGLHNETVNIWTHLAGSTVAVFLLAYLLVDLDPERYTLGEKKGWSAAYSGIPCPLPNAAQPSVSWTDAAGFATFLLSASVCLGFSAFFHTFLCHSEAVAVFWNRLDYVGIVVLITGTILPLLRYAFYCDPHLRNAYMLLIATFAAGTITTVVSPHARTPAHRRFRTWIFIALGLSAVFPIGHAVVRYGYEAASVAVSLPWVSLGGALYIIGALLYAERCPERYAPGRFDFFLSSHQIFHILILLAAWAHWCALAASFRYWHGDRQGTCPEVDLKQ